MAPTTAKTLMKDFRASFRRKKDSTPKIDKVKEQEDDEKAKLEEFKEKYGENLPPGYSDEHILGFLRARSLNVKDAEKLLRLDCDTMKFLRIRSLTQNYDITNFSKDYTTSNAIGYDNEGNLVRVMNIGLCDIKGYIRSMSTIEHLKLFLWFVEKDIEKIEKENKKKGEEQHIVYILDLANINVSIILNKAAIDTGFVALKLLQDHFHNLVKTVYIINAPAIFPSAFKVFKPVITESLHRKIKVFGSDGFKEELVKHIDADILPVYLGGRRRGGVDDPSGKHLIGIGGEIPVSYYPENFLDLSEEGVHVITVGAGSSVSFRFPVQEERTLFSYHFQAKDNDIGICLYLDDNSVVTKQKTKDEDVSKLRQLVPIIRCQCHLCPEVGSFVTWFTGTLVVYFDNTYSWMSSKEVAYKINLTPLSPSVTNTPECIRKEVMQKKPQQH